MSPSEVEKSSDVSPGNGAVATSAKPQMVDLPHGEALQPQEAARIMGAAPTRVIVFGGPYESGKTTLISSIYERFRKGPFADLCFCGSCTLLGFERISYLGRQASGLARPQMERTTQQMGRQMFHLHLYDSARRVVQDVLLTDLSGEEFENVRNFGGTCRGLDVIARADHFVLLIDGAKLRDVTLRQQARDESCTILRRLQEKGLLGKRSLVDVLFSKWDLVEGDPAGGRARDFAAVVETHLHECFGESVRCLKFERIIARHPDGLAPLATGVEKVLPAWCHEPCMPEPVCRFAVEDWLQRREFDRFLIAGCQG